MVGDGEPVQGPVNLDAHAVGGDEFLAPDKAKHLLRSQRDPHQSGIEGKGGVDVGIPPEDAVRERLVQIGGIFVPLKQIDVVLVHVRFRASDAVLCQGGLREADGSQGREDGD